MKKQIMISILLLLVIGITGCKDKNELVVSNHSVVDTSKMVHEHCTRGGTISNGEVSLNYEIYYTGEKLNLLQSEEMVISSDNSILDEYEQAYNEINKYYVGLTFYDTDVIRTETSVARKTVINYDQINISQLLSIEGEEDNIVEEGIAKVEKWKELSKKFGTTCETVSVEK